MNTTTISFEIHNLTTNEVLADNLSFSDVPELFQAYKEFYKNHEVVACYREVTVTTRVHQLNRDQFKHDWFEMLDDIIDNLYNS